MWPRAATCSRPERSARAGGVTLLKNRVTGVVDLEGVAPLPVAESAPGEWSELAHGMAEAVR